MSTAEAVVEVAIAVVERGGWFVVGLRSEGGALAGYWEFPGGKLLPGESPAQAAVREAREETGLEVEAIGLRMEVLHRYPHATVRLHFMACRLVGDDDNEDDAQPAPPFLWIERARLTELRFPEANAELLQHLAAEG